jgi:hypothetical protein
MSECLYENIVDYKSAFACLKKRFLGENKSIFRLDEDSKILTPDSVKYLMDNFVNNGYSGDVSFIEKIKHQLDSSSNKTHKNQAIEVLATAVWLWRVPPINAKDRKSSVEAILNLLPDESKITINDDNPIFKHFDGFASTGTYYNTNKPTELAYIVKFFQKYLELKSNSNPIDILNSDEFNGKMKIKTTKDYSYEDEENKANPKLSNKPDTSHDKPRTVSIHNALLHLFDSENFEPILSNDHKEKIHKSFSKIFNIEEDNTDIALKLIKEKLKELDLIHTDKLHIFYDDKIKNIWSGGIDFESKNIILHGAPGTGKTYMTEETVKARQIIENNSEYKLVQFHPSYGYEDFIEGIRPTEIIESSGQMKFELKNGIFKQMCIDAFKNLRETYEKNKKIIEDNKAKPKKDKSPLFEPKKYYFIADEVNRADLSRVFGELLLCLEDDKRLRIIDGKVEGAKIKTQNSNLWQNKDEYSVVKVNENHELDEEGKGFFGVPENIYFIGTMNDIDRSVDSFDMALRRRFVWKHYRCDYEAIENKYNVGENIGKYIEVCENLNAHITNYNSPLPNEKGFNLSDSYELGQSYFMKPKKLNQKELDRVWLEHISPILKEYLRAEYSDKEIQSHLNNAQKIFKIK